MKKRMLAILMLLCISSVVSASVNYTPSTFNCTTSDTVNYRSLTTPAESTGSQWHIEWDDNSNIASNRRAVIRVHEGEEAASATWVYSTLSSSYHPYKSGFGNGDAMVELRGRLDNRDGAQAPLCLVGTFYQ